MGLIRRSGHGNGIYENVSLFCECNDWTGRFISDAFSIWGTSQTSEKPTIGNPTAVEKEIDRGMTAVERIPGEIRISFRLTHPCGPNRMEYSEELRKLPAAEDLLDYRTTTRSWEWPFTFIIMDGETVVVQISRGRLIFRSNCVKQMIPSCLSTTSYSGEATDLTLKMMIPYWLENSALAIYAAKTGADTKYKDMITKA